VATPINYSVIKAFSMLKSFYRTDEWVTSCELSRRANLPQASGYRLIQTLEEIGAVVRGSRGRYRPGMLLVSLSHNVAIGDVLRDCCAGIAQDLADQFDLTVHIGILEGGMVSYVAKVSTPTAFPVHTRIGSQLEPYSSGLGKVLLAALPREQLEGIIMDGELVALTPQTITDRNVLREHLLAVYESGFAIDDRESESQMGCVAVPITDSAGRTIAAMSATDHADNMTSARQAQVREALMAAAAALSLKMYPQGPKLVA
jgi:IclR family acetate operon transcriptional repressor